MKRARRKNRKFYMSPGFVLTAILTILGLGITVSASNFAATGFKARNLEGYIEKLSAENKDLELKATNLKSLSSLESSLSEQNLLVPVTDIKYLKFSKQPENNSVSQK